MISVGKYEPADSSDGWNKMCFALMMRGCVTTRRDGKRRTRKGRREKGSSPSPPPSSGCHVDGDVYDDVADITDDVVDQRICKRE